MKNTTILMALLILGGKAFGQFELDQDSVMHYFKLCLNEYRVDRGVKPIEIDNRWKEFTEKHSSYLASKYPAPPIFSSTLIGGGDWDNFSNYVVEVLGYAGLFYENVGAYHLFKKNDAQKFQRISKSFNEDYYQNYVDMFEKGPTNKILASIVFNGWKNDLNGETAFNMRVHDLDGFYLSVSRAGDKFYAVFVGFDYL